MASAGLYAIVQVLNANNAALADFNLDFYTDVQDLTYLQHYLDQDPRASKYRYLRTVMVYMEGTGRVAAKDSMDGGFDSLNCCLPRKLTESLCEVIQDYGLVSFTTLNIEVPATHRTDVVVSGYGHHSTSSCLDTAGQGERERSYEDYRQKQRLHIQGHRGGPQRV